MNCPECGSSNVSINWITQNPKTHHMGCRDCWTTWTEDDEQAALFAGWFKHSGPLPGVKGCEGGVWEEVFEATEDAVPLYRIESDSLETWRRKAIELRLEFSAIADEVTKTLRIAKECLEHKEFALCAGAIDSAIKELNK